MHSEQYNLECYRQKLFGNIPFILTLSAKELALERKGGKEQKFIFSLSLYTKIDWKLKGGQLAAVGLTTKSKHHWYYGDGEALAQLREFLGGRVMFVGISDLYKPLQQVGQGTFSHVYLVRNVLDQKLYASKCVDKATLEQFGIGQMGLHQEIKSTLEINHENLVRLYETFEGDVSYYLIIDYLNIELVDLLKQPQDLGIDNIKLIMTQLAKGLQAIHDVGYMHRDLKPENIMFFEDLTNLKIVDFGLICQTPSFSKCGTPGYVAPEILNLGQPNDCYDEKVDIFSLGAIFYKLLTKQELFSGKSHDEILLNNAKCDIDFTIVKANKRIPREALNLLTLLLRINPDERPNCAQILKNEFLASALISSPEISKKQSEVSNYSKLAQCSPALRRRRSKLGEKFQLTDDNDVGQEGAMQPLPSLQIQHSSIYRVMSIDLHLDKVGEANFQSATQYKGRSKPREGVYRAPKPRQLLELYN